jgi:L-alanine-DL-glutamate epimerase-like enolase superfamily enzyme
VDSHGSFGAILGIKFARRAEEYGLTWFEEPYSGDVFDGLVQVSATTEIPIVAGENEFPRFGL